jgi:hypothetical protein
MNYNPYAAPQAPPPPMAAAPGAGTPQPWEIGEVLGQAWEIFKVQWAPLVGSYFVAMMLSMIPTFAHMGIKVADGSFGHEQPLDPDVLAANYGVGLINQFIFTFFEAGLIRMYLAAARGETPGFGDLFGGASRYLPLLAARFLVGLICFTGSMCLIVPGVIAYCGLWMASYYVIDAGLGPIDAIKASWEATTGQKGNIFLFLLLGGLIAASGVCACYLGIFVTVPLFFLAMAIVFLRISGRGTPALPAHPAAPPGGYGGPPPGGGYGGPPPQGGGYGGPQGGGGYGPPPGGGGGWPQR